MANPTPFVNEYGSYSASHGTDMALFTSGVQRMIAVYRIDPTYTDFAEIQAELTAGGGLWTITWANMQTFLAASPYATGLGLTRASFFPPNYNVSGPWRVTLIENQDTAGVGTGEVGVLIGWADIADASMPDLNRGAFMGALSNAMGNTPNVGVNEGGALVSRGAYAVETTFPGGVYVTHQNIPNVVPDGAPAYIQCRLAEDRGGDNIAGTADDSADGLCD